MATQGNDLLANTFWKVFSDHVRSLHFKISPDCEADIRGLIAHGAAEMSRLNYSPTQQEGAKRKLLFFADEMISLARLQHTQLLNGDIFRKIKEKLCPLHPLC
jgi:hypothetical protein